MLLTRDKDFNHSGFTQNLTSDGANFLSSIQIKYSSVCVTGLGFVFNDNTTVSYGSESESVSSIDLSSSQPQLYSFDSFCGDICDRIKICSMENICAEGGNSQRTNNLPKYIQNLTISSFEGDFASYSNQNCLKNFGIYYILSTVIDDVSTTNDLTTATLLNSLLSTSNILIFYPGKNATAK